MKVLLCGHRSYAAQGLAEALEKRGAEVWRFSRGEEGESGNIVSGDVFRMASNPFLRRGFDAVLNYICIKNGSVAENLLYLRSLVEYCRECGIRRLIHISTISVYPNDAVYVDESSHIEHDIRNKGAYSALKIECDRYLESEADGNLRVTYVRPGFVVGGGSAIRTDGIMIRLPLNMGLLLGDTETSLPVVDRDKMNEAMAEIVCGEHAGPVYLLLGKQGGTKYQYVREKTGRRIIPLPRSVTVSAARCLKALHMMSYSRCKQIEGLFKRTYFDPSRTERELNMEL